MIPIDNSVAGRVADVHHLLPDSGLHIVGEHFQRVAIICWRSRAPRSPSSRPCTATSMRSANAARLIARARAEGGRRRPTPPAPPPMSREPATAPGAAIASRWPAEIYGLESLRADIADAEHNTTRFVVMRASRSIPTGDGPVITSFVFRVRNVPAALYKALGGFATNGVNMIKLESYTRRLVHCRQFYADIEGHPGPAPVALALEELRFFSREVKILGVYPAHPSAPSSRPRRSELGRTVSSRLGHEQLTPSARTDRVLNHLA